VTACLSVDHWLVANVISCCQVKFGFLLLLAFKYLVWLFGSFWPFLHESTVLDLDYQFTAEITQYARSLCPMPIFRYHLSCSQFD